MVETVGKFEWTFWTYIAVAWGIGMIICIIIGFIWEHQEKKKVESIVKKAEENDERERRLREID